MVPAMRDWWCGSESLLGGMVALMAVSVVVGGCHSTGRPLRPQAGDVRTNSIGLELVYVPSGHFLMGAGGSPAELAARYDAGPEYFANEFPQHRVIISKGFWMSRTEVTQGQYRTVTDAEPWLEQAYVQQGDFNPVVFVSWDDATEFCRRLSCAEGRTYKLPTEAQWEYACRAGTTTQYSFGDDESQGDEYACFKGNTFDIGERHAQPVAMLKPNAFGLCDMHGNVWEWCRDAYDPRYHSELCDPAVDPENTRPAKARVLRGGCWYYDSPFGRSAYRGGSTPPGRRNCRIGFRVILLDVGQ
jgi:formylglycine-generating enzyme required for sulfatase activity